MVMDISVETAPPRIDRASEPQRLSPVVLSGLVGVFEVMLSVSAALILLYLYLGMESSEELQRYNLAIVIATQVQFAAFSNARLYNVPVFRQPFQFAGRILFVWTALFAVLVILAFLTKTSETFSRVWVTGWYVGGYIAILSFRFVLAGMVKRWTRAGRLETRAVIVGADHRAERLIESLESSPQTDVRICGIFDDRSDRVGPRVRGYPVLGSIKTLVNFARVHRVDLLIVSLPITAERRIVEMVKQLYVLPVDIRLASHADSLRLAPHAYSYVGGVPMLEVARKPVADWDHVVKSIEDRVLSALFLLMSLPLFAMIAAAIKLDSKGPVFFKQKRYGFNNEMIEVYKFRTLKHEMTDANAEKLVGPGDPRVTGIGRFLRRTSLDELPQLITVLKGGMSIVGPRPHATAAKAGNRLYQEVADGYYARHRVKPGITGWAQVNGWRGDTDTEDKLLHRTEHDLFYIENWSLWFDLSIIMRTPWALLKGTNAH
jgi:Undecaprenyl-phosphate glucose phosphotransferase